MSSTNCTVKSCRGVCRNTLFHWAEDKEEAIISLTKILRGHSERTAGGWVEPSSFYPNSESFVGHKTGRRIPLSGGAGDLSPMMIPAAQESECSCRALGKSGQGWVLFLLENEELRGMIRVSPLDSRSPKVLKNPSRSSREELWTSPHPLYSHLSKTALYLCFVYRLPCKTVWNRKRQLNI